MTYTVREVFNTLQGEGARAGARSVFVRFTGCNLWSGFPDKRAQGRGACAAWCDTSFVTGEKYTAVSLEERMTEEWAKGQGERWCVITGGEPTLQLDEQLVEHLHAEGWKIAIETNGTNATPALAMCDWVTASPKRRALFVLTACHELKVVLPGGAGGWTDDELHALKEQSHPQLAFVQPQDPIDPTRVDTTYLKRQVLGVKQDYERHVERCVEFVKRNAEWRLSLQTHKTIGIP